MLPLPVFSSWDPHQNSIREQLFLQLRVRRTYSGGSDLMVLSLLQKPTRVLVSISVEKQKTWSTKVPILRHYFERAFSGTAWLLPPPSARLSGSGCLCWVMGAVTEDVRKASLFRDVEEVSGKTQGRKRAARFPPTGRVHRGVKAQGSVCYALERVSQQ